MEEQQAREELFTDLIESAYLGVQIDGVKLSLAYTWLSVNNQLWEH